MSNPFVAEVRVFPFNFAPKGWAMCSGQLLPLSQNTALFSLLGTTYGGDGKSNFALPNMQGNHCISSGQGPGLSLYDLGEASGSDTVTLLASEMASHNHNLMAIVGRVAPNSGVPVNAALCEDAAATLMYTTLTTPIVQMNPNAIVVQGGSLPHNNLMPYLTLNFCIALQGVYPPRT
jgi:microcystin-dependent protein